MSTTPTPCCAFCGAITYAHPTDRDFWSCGSKVNADDNHERSTKCRLAETARLKVEIAIQKRLRSDDVAELNARLIQRREDYAAHSVKQAQELQTTRVRLDHTERRENHLREAMEQHRNYLEQEKCCCTVGNEAGNRAICGRCIALDMAEQALAQPAPPVVPVDDVAPLMDAGRKVIETNSDGGDIALAYHILDTAMYDFNRKHPGI